MQIATAFRWMLAGAAASLSLGLVLELALRVRRRRRSRGPEATALRRPQPARSPSEDPPQLPPVERVVYLEAAQVRHADGRIEHPAVRRETRDAVLRLVLGVLAAAGIVGAIAFWSIWSFWISVEAPMKRKVPDVRNAVRRVGPEHDFMQVARRRNAARLAATCRWMAARKRNLAALIPAPSPPASGTRGRSAVFLTVCRLPAAKAPRIRRSRSSPIGIACWLIWFSYPPYDVAAS